MVKIIKNDFHFDFDKEIIGAVIPQELKEKMQLHCDDINSETTSPDNIIKPLLALLKEQGLEMDDDTYIEDYMVDEKLLNHETPEKNIYKVVGVTLENKNGYYGLKFENNQQERGIKR